MSKTQKRRIWRLATTGAAVIAMATGCAAPDGAVEAAKQGLQTVRPGLHVVDVERSERNGDCAIIELVTQNPDGVTWVAVVHASGVWSLARIATDADYFDLDDPAWETTCQWEAQP